MIIDFKEIPEANSGGGLQDTFELFARDFLEGIGYEIILHPDRGPDGKKDMIVREVRNGVGGKTSIDWMVSCKHYAHSGKSVSDTDEPDITDRVLSHNCQGFIGVYSTLPAASLNTKLNGCRHKIEGQIYDRERIESEMLNSSQGIRLSRRFFPISTEKYINENPKPAKIFDKLPEINCEYCHKNLLVTKNGIFVAVADYGVEKIDKSGNSYHEEKNVYFSCKGQCDLRLEAKYRLKGYHSAGWEDIDDLMIPTLFLKNIVAYLNQLTRREFSSEAHENSLLVN